MKKKKKKKKKGVREKQKTGRSQAQRFEWVGWWETESLVKREQKKGETNTQQAALKNKTPSPKGNSREKKKNKLGEIANVWRNQKQNLEGGDQALYKNLRAMLSVSGRGALTKKKEKNTRAPAV